MVVRGPKMSVCVLSAIKNLQEGHGSTSREIMNYIISQYNGSESSIQRQIKAALKRGLEYGLLKKNNGHYFLNHEVTMPLESSDLIVPIERSRRRKRNGRQSHKRKSSRRSLNIRRRRTRHRSRRRLRSITGRSRRKSRRFYKRRATKSEGKTVRAKQVGCNRCRCTAKEENDNNLKNDLMDQQMEEEGPNGLYGTEMQAETRSHHSKSREHSLTRSGSSTNSDRRMDHDRQV